MGLHSQTGKQIVSLVKLLASALLLFALTHGHAQQTKDNPMVKMTTKLGEITIELYADQAPDTVENFLQYASDGFYDGTIFHRVIPGFVIQGGGFTEEMQQKTTRDPIRNESDNGVKNERGTLSMARLPDPHSASSQFFVNLRDNPNLDHQGGSQWGYAVFGKVMEGMDVIDEIAGVETTSRAGHRDVPATPVVVEQARKVE